MKRAILDATVALRLRRWLQDFLCVYAEQDTGDPVFGITGVPRIRRRRG